MRRRRTSMVCLTVLLTLILALSGCSGSGSESETAADVDYPGGYAALPGEGAQWNIQANLMRGGSLIQYGDKIFYADYSKTGDNYQNLIYIMDTVSGEIEEFIDLSEQFKQGSLDVAQMNIFDDKLFVYFNNPVSSSVSDCQIISIDLNTQEISTVVSGQSIGNMYVFDSKIYFIGQDQPFSTQNTYQIQRCDLDGSNLETVVRLDEMAGISPEFFIFDDSIYCAHNGGNTAWGSLSAYTLEGEEISTTLTEAASNHTISLEGFLPYEDSIYVINYHANTIIKWNKENDTLNTVYTSPTSSYGLGGGMSGLNMNEDTLYTIEQEYLNADLTVRNILLQRCKRNDSGTFEVIQTFTVFPELTSGEWVSCRIQCLPFGNFLVVDRSSNSNSTRYLYMIEESEVRQVLPVENSAE